MNETNSVKKHNPFVKAILLILKSLGVFIALLLLIFAFCHFNRVQELRYFPHNFSFFVSTDSAWKTVNPLLDLKAIDLVLSEPEYSNLRGSFMNLRSSSLRKNPFFALVASRSVKAAFYKQNEYQTDFLLTVDFSFLSFATRILPFASKFIHVENLSYNSAFGVFEYNNDGTIFYIKPVKNIVVVSNAFGLLLDSLKASFGDYSQQNLSVMKKKSRESLHIVTNAFLAAKEWTGGNDVMKKLVPLIQEESLTSVMLKITDSEISLDANLPVSDSQNENEALYSLVSNDSKVPSIVSRLNGNIQYYTLLNAGTLSELKDAILPLVKEKNEADSLWKNADTLCKSVFFISLEDLLFSWTGTEFAVLGIEKRNNPVFALQIKDEEQRQKVFEKITSSILIKDNSNLLLDGMRVPRLELPLFLQNLTSLFGLSVPEPYYVVLDDFIYFSASAESLSAIYKAKGVIESLPANKNYVSVSKKINEPTLLSLYYNLKRSVPFFLRSNADITKALSLYSLGKADFSVKNNIVSFKIHAVSNDESVSKEIPGFPKTLQSRSDGNLYSSGKENPILFWTENKKTLTSLTVPEARLNSKDFSSEIFVCANEYPQKKSKENGALWAVTKFGEAYLLNRNLEVLEGFPILTGKIPISGISSAKNGIVFATEDELVFVDCEGKVSTVELSLTGSIKSAPTVMIDSFGTEWIALYDKSFIGKIIVLKNRTASQLNQFDVPGIAFGSPIFAQSGKTTPYVAFITQLGDFYIFQTDPLNFDNALVLQKNIEGVYSNAPVAVENNFFVLSDSGLITRISVFGETLSVGIPDISEISDSFFVQKDGNIFVCPDMNLVYGFDKNLELLYGYPLPGWGIPCFADINGDNKKDFFALSIDGKINAWNIR